MYSKEHTARIRSKNNQHKKVISTRFVLICLRQFKLKKKSNFFQQQKKKDHQKLEREAKICRQLKHSNIGEFISLFVTIFKVNLINPQKFSTSL